jgi:2-desacetyl-2-hydroxyethyl bacteriochlorophyllide A dehydrogenase
MKPYKKIVFESPGQIRVAQTTFDLRLESDFEIIIQNCYSHVSAGTELACLAGLEDWFTMPGTPGYTSIGKVIEKGSAIDFVNIHDYVYTFGPHAGYFKINITDRWHGVCVKLPSSINPVHAAFTHMGGIAITALRKSRIELGDWVAISGLGAIGNLAAQLAQLQGANVLAMDIQKERLDIARKCGLLNVHLSKDKVLKDIIHSASQHQGISTWIDATGIPAVIKEAATCINPYGELILLGSPRSPHHTNLTDFLQTVHLLSHGAIEVKGALEFIFPTHTTEFLKHSITRNSEIILELIASNRLHIQPLVSHVIAVDHAAQVYTGLRSKPETFTGVVFDWGL